MLLQISQRLSRSRPARHLFYFSLAVLSTLLMSYHFGTFDQSIHIPFLKATADPSLYPNDAFVALRLEHYSYFWYFFIPFYKLGILEETLFVGHLLASYLTFWALYQLTETLFSNPLTSMFGALVFVIPHVSFAGFPLIEFSLLNRTFVMPFLLLAINLYLRGIRTRAFLLLGIMYNLHVLSVHFPLAMFMLDFVIHYKQIGFKKIVSSVGVFVLAALPVLLWKLQDNGMEIGLEPEWFSLLSRAMMQHLFFLTGNSYVLAASLSAAAAYYLYWVAYRALPRRQHDETVTIFILASTIIVLVQVIVATWMPISILLQLQIVRAGMFAVVFAYLYFADYLARKWMPGGERKPGDTVLTVTFFLGILTFVTVLVESTQRWWAATPRRVQLTAWVLSLLFLGSLVFAIWAKVWKPGIYVYGVHTPWRETQEWARDNTPKDAIFITPMNKWWLDEAEWRVFSERQTVSTLSELLEAAFEPEYMSIWRPRFTTLAPGALEAFRGDYLENQKITGAAYNSLTTTAFVDAACKFDATYLVVEYDHPQDLPVLFENSGYRVYDLRQKDCATSK